MRRVRVAISEKTIGVANLRRRFEAAEIAAGQAELILLGNRSRNPGSGSGDMATYDTDNRGKVDFAEQVALPVYTTATRPTAAAGNRGYLIRVKDASASEQLQVCLLNSDGSTYSWTIVAMSPS
jgi:hypothetical protein